MAIDRTVVTLRLIGDDLRPAEVTEMLGAEPSYQLAKGAVHTTASGRNVVGKTGIWNLGASDRSPGDIDAQVTEILARLTPDIAIWQALGCRFDIDLFCGLFMVRSNEVEFLSAQTLAALSARSISLSLDIYSPPIEEEADSLESDPA